MKVISINNIKLLNLLLDINKTFKLRVESKKELKWI